MENRIAIPTREQLLPLMKEATKEKNAARFIEDYLDSVDQILAKDTRQFRSYGVYWWPIKKMLVDRGITDYGVNIDAPCMSLVSHLSEAEILCAAYANKMQALDNGTLYSTDHQYDGTLEEPYYFTLADDELENIIANPE